MKSLTYLLLIGVSIGSGCTSGDENASAVTKPVVSHEKKVMPPFRFHKEIEVKPGLTFDVVSWGRGSETSGAYIILRSDSTHLKYKTTTGELDGSISDAWNMDMDSDGNPEIFIQAAGVGEGSYLSMYIYEFNDAGNGQKITFPQLSGSLKKGYAGNDSMYVRDGKLFREFPVAADEGDTASVKTLSKRLLEYSLRNNSFSVKEIESGDPE